MSASLVGSEMCIRDRVCSLARTQASTAIAGVRASAQTCICTHKRFAMVHVRRRCACRYAHALRSTERCCPNFGNGLRALRDSHAWGLPRGLALFCLCARCSKTARSAPGLRARASIAATVVLAHARLRAHDLAYPCPCAFADHAAQERQHARTLHSASTTSGCTATTAPSPAQYASKGCHRSPFVHN
eukprot:11073412-Alexandrium_andersonii.AAC.1